MSDTIHAEYFTDLLCIWAYGAHVRIRQLHADYRKQLSLKARYIPLFACTGQRIGKGWAARGGYAGFGRHCREVASHWDHVKVHPDIWKDDPPASSTSPHLFLKAVQLLEDEAVVDIERDSEPLSSRLAWLMRERFFAGRMNIARYDVQCALARELDLPLSAIRARLDSGQAHAALHDDFEAQQRYQVTGSPTLVLNEGRQRLYGNVGYRIIQANVRELLHDPQAGEASWC